ncbi:hypothetical protein [Brevibacillus centrosporus]|uniref:hypothetical protein n=1 Tax=Brevibacillus centrosporus TaxID=54910 RepID=UPI003B01E4BB
MSQSDARRDIDLTAEYKGVGIFSRLIGWVLGPIFAYTAPLVHTSTHLATPDAGNLLMTFAFGCTLMHVIIEANTIYVHEYIKNFPLKRKLITILVGVIWSIGSTMYHIFTEPDLYLFPAIILVLLYFDMMEKSRRVQKVSF